MKQPQQINTTEQLRSSSGFAPSFRQWGSRRLSFSSRRTSASADPIEAVVARVIHEEVLQDSDEVDPAVEQIDTRNGATAGSRIPSNPVP
jgi:hypothetical protein